MNPDAFEGYIGDPTCSDGVDNDCDGVTDDADRGCLPWEPVSILVRADPLSPGELDGLVGGDPVADKI